MNARKNNRIKVACVTLVGLSVVILTCIEPRWSMLVVDLMVIQLFDRDCSIISISCPRATYTEYAFTWCLFFGAFAALALCMRRWVRRA